MSDTLKVWVGCLACYNEGRLTGDWVEALEAEDYVPCRCADHEEWWCLDVDMQGWVTGECFPSEAQRIAEAVEALPEHIDQDAVKAWLEDQGESITDLDIADFESRYRGEWGTFKEYAESFADETLELDTRDDIVARYFDYDRFANDLAYDYTVIESPQGVYIFDPS